MAPVIRARNKYNALKRYRGCSDPATVAAATDFRVEQLAAHIEKVVSQTPPTQQQRARLAVLLLAGEAV